jgi:ectoine hydroxylase-related dioxygenase (phytanoyl-CoA dioxygenase family)
MDRHAALRADFARDGVVVIRDAFGDWIETLRAGFERNLAAPGPFAIENVRPGEGGRFFEDYCNWQRIPEYRDFIMNSPAAEIAGRIMGSSRVQIFHEHVLVKEPGTAKPTPWHQDMPYYCVHGRSTASYWIPLDPVTQVNTLRALKTSHLWPKLVRPKRWASNEDFYASDDDFMDMPAIADGDPRIIAPALEPGDAILFNFHCVHGAPGNQLATRRRAFSARYVGDDVTFLARPGRTSPPFPGIDQQSGEPLREDWFPVVWRA